MTAKTAVQKKNIMTISVTLTMLTIMKAISRMIVVMASMATAIAIRRLRE